MTEVTTQLTMIEQLFSASKEDDGEEVKKYRMILNGVKTVAPQFFELLDVNGDKKLKKTEFKVITDLEKSLRTGGGMKQLVRDCFGIIDSDGNDEISKQEWENADLPRITATFHALFPLRPTPEELHSVLMSLISTTGTSEEHYALSDSFFSVIDKDGNGMIQRSEVGFAYNTAGKQFLEISKTIKEMGPMLALFGGGAPPRDEF